MEDQKKGILLESGTNEIEIMEFTIDGNSIWHQCGKSTGDHAVGPGKAQCPMPTRRWRAFLSPAISVLTVVDLPKYLSGQPSEKGPKDLFIVTNFNKMYIAFRVHTVVGISRHFLERHPKAGPHGIRRHRRRGHRHRPVRRRPGDDSGF